VLKFIDNFKFEFSSAVKRKRLLQLLCMLLFVPLMISSSLIQPSLQESATDKTDYSVRGNVSIPNQSNESDNDVSNTNGSSTIAEKMALNGQEMTEPKIINSSFKVEKIVDAIDSPIGIAFLDQDDFLIIEKNSGKVKRFANGSLLNQTILDLNVANVHERGLLAITVSKDNPENKTYVFLYFTESPTMDGEEKCKDIYQCDPQHNYLGNRLYRYEFKDNSLVNPKLLVDIPPSIWTMHHGGKIVVGKDRNVYLGVGEQSAPITLASNVVNGAAPYGSGGILRITQNGSGVTPGIFGEEHPYILYYAYGIRNIFGLGFDPVTGNLWHTENGPGFGDEINLAFPGFNSGWSEISGNREFAPLKGNSGAGNISLNPVNLTTLNGIGQYSTPELATDKYTLGPTSLVFLNSSKYGKDYYNDMFVSVYNFHGNLYHFDLTKNRTDLILNKTNDLENKTSSNPGDLEPYVFGKDFGGIADLEVSPDGYLYIVSIVNQAIYKILPVEDICLGCV
jgi:glucose/arabinose dehydrogenase